MARIKLVMPANILMTVNIDVRITDINYGNHLGNDALVSIIHEARVLWLSENKYSETNIERISLIMSDLAVEYLAESFYGDTLTIVIAAGEISTVAFELYYAVTTIRADKTILIAKVKTGMVCYDYINKKIMSIPEKLINILKGLTYC